MTVFTVIGVGHRSGDGEESPWEACQMALLHSCTLGSTARHVHLVADVACAVIRYACPAYPP